MKEGGSEIVQSLATLFKRVEEENKIPIQWRGKKIKSVYKRGNKERIQESQREIFLMNIVYKIYERVKKLQNENKQANISSMQTAGKKKRSTIDNLVIMNAIIEKQRQDHKNIYMLFADSEICFDKLWLKDSSIEMERIGYNNSGIKMLYEINKITEIVVDTTIGNTKSIEVTQVVKKGLIFGPIMCCATTGKVNDVGERFHYKYGEIEIGMSIYIDDISVAGGPEEVKKGIRKCARMEGEKKTQ